MATPSFDDIYNLGKAEMILRRPELVVNEGDVTDFLLAAAAAMADKNLQFAAELFRKTFVDTADGADLTTLADDHFSIVRKAGTAALVPVTFTRATSATAGTIPAGTEVATGQDASGNDVRFTTVADLPFIIGETIKSVNANCTKTGPQGNVKQGTITRILVSLFDTFSVANNSVAAGGNEEESDEELRERIRNRPNTFRRGTLSALEFGALQVVSVRIAVATENLLSGLVRVYVSDENGSSNLQMVSDVIIELENWRAAGINVNVTGGKIKTQNVTVVLTIDTASGSSVGILTQPVIDAITERVNQLRIGETLYLSLICQAVMNVDKSILSVSVTTPTANVVPLPEELIRVGTVTVS